MACWAVTSRGAAVGDMRSQVYRGISHCSQRLSAGWLRKVQLSQFHWAPSKSSSLCARGGGSSAGSTETGHSVAASYSPWKHQCCKHFSPRKHQWVQMLYFKTTSKRLNAILEGHINAANSVLQRGINGYFKTKKNKGRECYTARKHCVLAASEHQTVAQNSMFSLHTKSVKHAFPLCYNSP